jgi:hypothetical protein
MTCVAIRASPWLFEAMRVADEEPGVRRDQALVRRFAMRGCHCCSRPVTALPVAEVNDLSLQPSTVAVATTCNVRFTSKPAVRSAQMAIIATVPCGQGSL